MKLSPLLVFRLAAASVLAAGAVPLRALAEGALPPIAADIQISAAEFPLERPSEDDGVSNVAPLPRAEDSVSVYHESQGLLDASQLFGKGYVAKAGGAASVAVIVPASVSAARAGGSPRRAASKNAASDSVVSVSGRSGKPSGVSFVSVADKSQARLASGGGSGGAYGALARDVAAAFPSVSAPAAPGAEEMRRAASSAKVTPLLARAESADEGVADGRTRELGGDSSLRTGAASSNFSDREASRRGGREDLEALIRSALLDSGAEEPFGLVLYGADQALARGGGAESGKKAKIRALDFNPANGRLTARLAFERADGAVADAMVRGTVERQEIVAVPARDVRRGEVLTEEMIDEIPVSVKQLRPDMLRDKKALAGRTAARNLAAGHPVRAREAQAPLLVHRGDVISVAYISSAVMLKMSGAALEDGAQGEVVRVRNDEGGKTLRAVVTGAGEARVVAEGASGAASAAGWLLSSGN